MQNKNAQKAATTRDVARLAGVSVATVSRVVNASDSVRSDTALKVQQAASSLGFRPNLMGRNLRSTRTRTIGVMFPTLKNPVYSDCLQSIELAAKEQDHVIAVSTTGYDADAEDLASERLLQQRVDGIILTVADASRSPLLDKLDAEAIPYVLVFNQLGGKNTTAKIRPTVCVDNARAAQHLVEHLIELGHHSICMIAGAFNQSDRSKQRFAGYQNAMRRAGLPWREPLELAFDANDTRPQLQDLLSQRTLPTALFCSNDQLAMMVMRDLRRMGINVPDEIAVVGFDGVQVGEWMYPALTTVVQPTAEIGRTAVDLLLAVISGKRFLGSALLHHTLRVGGTAQRRPQTPS